MRVLMIDDHALFRMGLVELLERRGIEVVAAVSDFRFIGGSMGFVQGERVATAMDQARRAHRPFVTVTTSGLISLIFRCWP